MPKNHNGFSPVLLLVAVVGVTLVVLGAVAFMSNQRQDSDTATDQPKKAIARPKRNLATSEDNTITPSTASATRQSPKPLDTPSKLYRTQSFQLRVAPSWQVATESTKATESTTIKIPEDQLTGTNTTVYIEKIPPSVYTFDQLEKSFIDQGYVKTAATLGDNDVIKFRTTLPKKHTETGFVDQPAQHVVYIMQSGEYIYNMGYDYLGASPNTKDEAIYDAILASLTIK